GGFLEIREVAGNGRHEAVRRLLSMPEPISSFLRAPGLFHEFSKRDGCTAGLTVQPLPVPWKQRHFAGNDAQLRPPRPTRRDGVSWCRSLLHSPSRRRFSEPFEHLFRRAAKVEFDLLARLVVEDQDRCSFAAVEHLLRLQRDLPELARRDALKAL